MRKYIIYSPKGKTSIVEVECELISGLEDQSIMQLPNGEFKAKILAPNFLFELNSAGKSVSPIYYSHAFYSTEADAKVQAEKDARSLFERDLSKKDIAYTEEEVQAKLLSIQVVLL
jgi:hypothetical protein